MLYLIILKLLFNDDKVRSIEALIIDGGVAHKERPEKLWMALARETFILDGDNYRACRYVFLFFLSVNCLWCFRLCLRAMLLLVNEIRPLAYA